LELGVIAGPEAEARHAFYRYLIESTHTSLRNARQVIEEALASGARSPVLLSMHGTTLAMGVAWGLSDSPEQDLSRAESAAKEALSEEHRNAHALLVLATVALVRGQWEVAVVRAREGIAEGGGQPTILSSAAILLSLAGEFAEGVEVMRTALQLNPAHPGSLHGMIAVDHILCGDDAAALAEAGLIHSPDNFWGPCYRALALAGLGYLEDARREFDDALAIEPALADDPLAIVGGYARLDDQQIRVLADRVELIMSGDDSVPGGSNSEH
jgi:tetratricopeptide (TPR) repeat protein